MDWYIKFLFFGILFSVLAALIFVVPQDGVSPGDLDTGASDAISRSTIEEEEVYEHCERAIRDHSNLGPLLGIDFESSAEATYIEGEEMGHWHWQATSIHENFLQRRWVCRIFDNRRGTLEALD